MPPSERPLRMDDGERAGMHPTQQELTSEILALSEMLASRPGTREVRGALDATCRSVADLFAADLVTFRVVENSRESAVVGASDDRAHAWSRPATMPEHGAGTHAIAVTHGPNASFPEPFDLQMDDAGRGELPARTRVAVPATRGGEPQPTGYLHITAGATTDASTASLADRFSMSLMTMASLMGTLHFVAHQAAQDVRERRFVDRMQRFGQRLIALAPTIGTEVLAGPLGELGEVLGASHLTLWELDARGRHADRVVRWESDRADVPKMLADGDGDTDLAFALFDGLEAPLELFDGRSSEIGPLIIDVRAGDVLNALAVPGSSRARRRCTLVVSRQSSEPWQLWERAALTDLVDMINAARFRPNLEQAWAAVGAEAETAAALALAELDQVTGLAAESSMIATIEDELIRLEADEAGLGVVMLNLEQFAEVNEMWGRATGDFLLRLIAERLTGASRQSDLVTRPADDRFVIVARERNGSLAPFVDRLHEQVSRPIDLGGRCISVQASISAADAVKGDTAASLLARAHAALAHVAD